MVNRSAVNRLEKNNQTVLSPLSLILVGIYSIRGAPLRGKSSFTRKFWPRGGRNVKMNGNKSSSRMVDRNVSDYYMVITAASRLKFCFGGRLVEQSSVSAQR